MSMKRADGTITAVLIDEDCPSCGTTVFSVQTSRVDLDNRDLVRAGLAVEGTRVAVVSVADLDALVAERDMLRELVREQADAIKVLSAERDDARRAAETYLDHIRVLTGKP